MTDLRSALFLADIVQAISLLQPSNDLTAAAIAAHFGLNLVSEEPTMSAPDLTTTSDGPAAMAPPVPSMTVSAPTAQADARWVPSVLDVVESADVPVAIQETLLPDAVLSQSGLPRPDPLFRPEWTRAIITTACATWAFDGLPDIEHVVIALARAEPIRSIPRLGRMTVHHGVELLVDRGEALAPFFADQASFESAVKRIVGRESSRVANFIGVPRMIGSGPKTKWRPFQPPAPGTPVVVLTDLGIQSSPTSFGAEDPKQWARFALAIRQAQCRLIAIVPYSPRRWPRALSRAMGIIFWDRRTTASAVRRAVGRRGRGRSIR